MNEKEEKSNEIVMKVNKGEQNQCEWTKINSSNEHNSTNMNDNEENLTKIWQKWTKRNIGTRLEHNRNEQKRTKLFQNATKMNANERRWSSNEHYSTKMKQNQTKLIESEQEWQKFRRIMKPIMTVSEEKWW